MPETEPTAQLDGPPVPARAAYRWALFLLAMLPTLIASEALPAVPGSLARRPCTTTSEATTSPSRSHDGDPGSGEVRTKKHRRHKHAGRRHHGRRGKVGRAEDGRSTKARVRSEARAPVTSPADESTSPSLVAEPPASAPPIPPLAGALQALPVRPAPAQPPATTGRTPWTVRPRSEVPPAWQSAWQAEQQEEIAALQAELAQAGVTAKLAPRVRSVQEADHGDEHYLIVVHSAGAEGLQCSVQRAVVFHRKAEQTPVRIHVQAAEECTELTAQLTDLTGDGAPELVLLSLHGAGSDGIDVLRLREDGASPLAWDVPPPLGREHVRRVTSVPDGLVVTERERGDGAVLRSTRYVWSEPAHSLVPAR